MSQRICALNVCVSLALLCSVASGQSPKELKTKSGVPVVVINFISSRPDCSTTPGPIAGPVIREKPTHGVMQLLIIATNVPATGNCPARKIPTAALIYTPDKDFAGNDSVQIEVGEGNKTTTLSYRISVQAPAGPAPKIQQL